MIARSDRSKLALVLIDVDRARYSRFVGNKKDVAIEGRHLTEDEIEHFRINPADFIGIHCGPEAA